MGEALVIFVIIVVIGAVLGLLNGISKGNKVIIEQRERQRREDDIALFIMEQQIKQHRAAEAIAEAQRNTEPE